MPRLPLWARVVQRVDAYSGRVGRAYRAVRDELVLSRLAPELRAEMTDAAYRHARVYLPGGSTFERGLFEWERSALARLRLPPGAKILLGAAGGGRELVALAELGYTVSAFEPNAELCAGAQRVAATLPAARVLRGAYADLIEAVENGSGALLALREPYDAFILGWGSFTHLTDGDEQQRLLSALRRLGQNTPVLLSFFVREETPRVASSNARGVLRALLRGSAGASLSPGLAYEAECGFIYRFTPSELSQLAERAGYRVDLFEKVPYAHAILLPRER